jgi:hypothetical protein
VKSNLKITYGLRWERDGNPKCLDNCFDRMNTEFGLGNYQGGASIPYNQTIQTGLQYAYAGLEAGIWEPRFGFVWSPFGSSSNKKTVIRGGVGLFANLFAVSVANNIDTNSPSYFSPTVTFGTIGLRTDSTTSAAAAYGAYNALETGFKAGYTLGQIQKSLAPIAFSAPGFYSTPNNFVAPKIWEWSFEIEQPLSARNVLAITYSGSHGYNEQLTNLDANLFVSTKNYPNGFQNLPLAAPDPRFLTVTQVLTSGYSNYDGLTTAIRHAISHGFQAQGSWTWSHALGVVGSGTTGTGAIYNPNSIAAAYGPLTFDTRHLISGDLLWNSPSKYGNHFLNGVLGGWAVGTKFYYYTGNPFSVTNTTLAANVNSAVPSQNVYLADVVASGVQGTSCGSTNIATANGVPCLYGPSSTAVVNGTRPSEFGVTTVKLPGQVQQLDYGNTGPNEFRGASYFDIDAQITKNFTLREHYKFGIGAQFYNLLNHPNFANPSGTVTSSSLGLASSTVAQPSSIYGTGQGAAVSGRLAVLVGTFRF